MTRPITAVVAWVGPTPAETRTVILNLCRALGKIGSTPRQGGPASIGPARAIAYEALRVMPMHYLPRDQPRSSDADLVRERDRLRALGERVVVEMGAYYRDGHHPDLGILLREARAALNPEGES